MATIDTLLESLNLQEKEADAKAAIAEAGKQLGKTYEYGDSQIELPEDVVESAVGAAILGVYANQNIAETFEKIGIDAKGMASKEGAVKYIRELMNATGDPVFSAYTADADDETFLTNVAIMLGSVDQDGRFKELIEKIRNGQGNEMMAAELKSGLQILAGGRARAHINNLLIEPIANSDRMVQLGAAAAKFERVLSGNMLQPSPYKTAQNASAAIGSLTGKLARNYETAPGYQK